jgi:hypothetical protein
MMDVLIAVKRLATLMVVAAIMVLVAPLVFGYAILKTEWLRMLGKPTNPTEVRRAAQAVQRAATAAKAKADWTLEEVSRIAVSPPLVVDDRVIQCDEFDQQKALNGSPSGMYRTYLENS